MTVLSVSTIMFHQWKWGETQVFYQFLWIKGLFHQRICPNLSRLGTGSGANLLIHYRFTHWTLHLHLAAILLEGRNQQKHRNFWILETERHQQSSLYFFGGKFEIFTFENRQEHPTLLFIGILLVEPTINPRSSRSHPKKIWGFVHLVFLCFFHWGKKHTQNTPVTVLVSTFWGFSHFEGHFIGVTQPRRERWECRVSPLYFQCRWNLSVFKPWKNNVHFMWFVSVSGMKPIQNLTVQLHVQPARNHQDGFGDIDFRN